MTGSANLLMTGLLAFSPELSLENTNILAYDELQRTTDYNRIRGELSLELKSNPNFFGKLIVDNTTSFTSRPNSLTNTTSIYRASVKYRGDKHFWSMGKQRIPLGVGRIWNPIDIFNPIDAEAIESSERKGTESIRYEYAINTLSNVDATVANGRGAVRIKGFLDFADVALVGLWDEDNSLDVVGWEMEGELFNTGIELRSEGGWFHNRTTGDHYSDFIIGAEYGFANSLSLLTEYRYEEINGNDSIGIQATYTQGMLWTYSLPVVTNLDDQSGFVAPAIEYSLSDEMTLRAGAFFYQADDGDQYDHIPDRYYLYWFVHF